MLTTTRLFSPLVGDMRRELDEAFRRSFGNGSSVDAAYMPLTIWEDDQHVYVEADVPGFSIDGLDLTYQDGQLWIAGERKLPKDDGTFWHNDRKFGRFERGATLPDTVDPESIQAEYENGVLYVTFSKRPEARPTKVRINARNGNGKLTDKSN